jgi:phage gp45-like
MSISNLDFTSYNYLTNMASVNAEEVNTNILTKSDPDITDLQFDMLEGINTNETIQQQIDGVSGDITGLEADVLTLQGQMTTVQGQISTLDGEVNTLQSQMTTAQDDINDLQSDVIALYSISSANSAAIAGLSVSQAAQDVIIATHTGQITTLQGDVNDAEDDINALQTKTQHQSATGFRTIFATTVEVGGVSLNTNTASTFDDGLSASAAITSSAGTSQFSSLLVNTAAEVTNDLTITDGEIYIRRNTLTASKKVILYDNTTGNDYDYLGFWTDSGAAGKKFLNAEIDGVAGSAFQWYAGDGAGTARTLLKQLTSANETGYTPLATFLKTPGFSQQIQMVKDAPNNRVRIDMLGDTAGVNTFDGQIIQEEGNGVDDNRGTMTIQSGGLAINALSAGLNIQATTSTLIQSGTTTTLTSGGETEINCTILDINASGVTTINSVGGMTLTETNANSDIVIRSNNGDVNLRGTDIGIESTTGDITLTSDAYTTINCASLDINVTGLTTFDTQGITITGTGAGAQPDVILTNPTSGVFQISSATDQDLLFGINGAADFYVQSDRSVFIEGTTGDITFTSGAITTMTSTGETEINCSILDINASSAITMDTGTTITLTSALETEINCDTLDINATSAITLDTPTTITLTSTQETEINCSTFDLNATGDVTITTTTGHIEIDAGTGKDVNITGCDQFKVTTESTSAVPAFQHISAVTTNDNMRLQATGGYSMRIGEGSATNGVVIVGVDSGTSTIDSNASSLTVRSDAVLTLRGDTSVTTTSTTNINATGSNATNIGNASSTTTIGGPTTISGTTTINANTTINVDNTFNLMPTATIITNVSATVPSGFLYCDGQAVNRLGTYARLFASIGTTFGVGNGTTTFNVPNFLGAFLRGASTQTVGGVTYGGAAVGTAQQDAVLNPLYASNEGYFNTTSGAATRHCVSRNRITADDTDTNTGILPRFDRTATENRPFNYTVYYYIRY